MILAEGLQYVSLAGVVAVGVLKALEKPFFQNQHRHSQLVPEELHASDVHYDVYRVRQELQGELGLQQGMDLLNMIRYIFTDVLSDRQMHSQSTDIMICNFMHGNTHYMMSLDSYSTISDHVAF